MSKKKFFSGNSVRQALLAAASHFELPPEQIAYREVEKKSGFLKAKKRAVIEVDAENPRQPLAGTAAAPADTAGGGSERQVAATKSATTGRARTPRSGRSADGAGEPVAEDAAPGEEGDPTPADETASAPTRRRRSPSRRGAASTAKDPQDAEEIEQEIEQEIDGAEEDDRRPEWDDDDRDDDDRSEDEDEDEDEDDEDDEDAQDEDDDREPLRTSSRRQPSEATAEPSPARASDETASEPGRRRRRRRRGGRGRGSAAGGGEGSDSTGSQDDLVALPEHPRRPADRYAEAHGPQADATRQALDKVLEVAGLELSYTVLQGEDRLEVELTGRDEALLVAEGGELLRAVEHLVPRVVRSLTGEPVSVRVDSADFHEIHEEQLRSLAQRVASEVRRSERPRTLEPMSPADRRIVHITLADEPRVTSMSEGSGYFKRLVVKPS